MSRKNNRILILAVSVFALVIIGIALSGGQQGVDSRKEPVQQETWITAAIPIL